MSGRPFFVDSPRFNEPKCDSIYATDWVASWWRHAPSCKPGLYYVMLSGLSSRAERFFGLTNEQLRCDAVMDDLGNLVPVRGAA